MTKNINFVSHKKSKVKLENGKPQLPLSSALVEGEIAVNYAKDVETLSIKNESGTVVTFSSDNYYTEQKLGSGFTGANSAKTVTEAIEEIQPNVNADWDETDETSPAFIENKPFGDVCEYVTGYDDTFTASTMGPSHYGIGGLHFSGSTVFRHGDTYRVTINDDVYVTNAVYFDGTNLALNLEEGASSPYNDTWSIFNTSAGFVFASTEIEYGDTVHLKVEQLVCTTKLIDNKYINSSWEKGTGVNSVKLIGNGGTASGEFSVSEGYQTTASGSGSHAEGGLTEANGTYSHAEGWTTFANSSYSHTEGAFTQTNKDYSHAEGYSTSTRNEYEHASGRYNNSVSASTIFGDSGNTLFSVGNGEQNSRHNAFEIRQNGDIYIVDKASQDVKLQDKLIDANNYYTKSETSGATELTAAFNLKANVSDLNPYFDDAKYENSGSTKVINFYHGSTIKATIDASDFIVDGMVEDVKIENGYLVIDFNTESGKQDIRIPLTDIFDPSNYYNKAAIDTLVGSGFTSSSITDVIIENEEITSAALTDLDDRKLDASAYTPTDLSNYYQKSETSGKTEIATALSGKSDNGHTHVANAVTAMTGYAIATSASSISTTDTLIQAIGKLEKRIALLEAALEVQNNGDVYGAGGDY